MAKHLGFRESVLPLLAACKDLAEAAHRHPMLLELALGDLRRPTTTYAQSLQHLRQLSGKDLQNQSGRDGGQNGNRLASRSAGRV